MSPQEHAIVSQGGKQSRPSSTGAVPLSGSSVFVPASPVSSADPAVPTTPGSSSLGRPSVDSPAAGRTSSSRNTPRRSLAHQPSLLGLGRTSEEATEEVLLAGLGIHAGKERDERAVQGNREHNLSGSVHDEEQFRIDDGSDAEGEDAMEGDRTPKRSPEMSKWVSGTGSRTYGSASHTLESYSAHSNPFRDEDDEDNILYGDQDVDLEARDGDARGCAYELPFEPTTRRERTWMWTSVVFVIALSMVSIAIAVDIIDWPGDGIGKN